MDNIYTHRLLGRFIIEAVTPLAVGSGQSDAFSDSLVARDVNGLPYIPGTSIAGVLRHMIGEENAKDLFGFQECKNGKGSKVIFTEAKILDSKGNVVDNMVDVSSNEDEIVNICNALPVRQHIRIGSKGTGVDSGKFDEQVVYSGTRFCFEVEMVCTESESEAFALILEKIQNKNFRLGGGTRTGFGEIKIVKIQTSSLNLRNEKDLELYLDKSSDLSQCWNGWQDCEVKTGVSEGYVEYRLELKPADFFIFSSGFGDDDADITPVKERIIRWNDKGTAEVVDNVRLIPASSIKGAVSHRTAYHWNRANQIYAEVASEEMQENEAVRNLFGYQDGTKQVRGKVMFSDIYVKELDDSKDTVQYHVKIDRFTGGAMAASGALFQEKVVYGADTTLRTSVYVSKDVDEKYINAFEDALSDITKGLLPLGGGVNRGHGMFTGKWTKINA